MPFWRIKKCQNLVDIMLHCYSVKFVFGVNVISLLICHKFIFVVNMPDKIVTLNDILVYVFSKSG